MTLVQRITLARDALNADRDSVAQSLGLDPQVLEDWELGLAAPDEEQLRALANAYRLDVDFFLRNTPIVPITPISPRVDELEDLQLETLLAQAQLWLERYLDIEAFLESEDIPALQLPDDFPRDVSTSKQAAAAAEALRAVWGLGGAPIRTMGELLPDYGIRVGMASIGSPFEAMAFRTDDMFRWPFIMVEQDRAGEDQRFAMARSLAEIVLNASDRRLTSHFAATFLVPERALIRDVGRTRRDVDPIELTYLKFKWGISVHHLVGELATLKIIDRETFDGWIEEGREIGWHEIEAEAGYLMPDEPTIMERLANRFEVEGFIDEDETANLIRLPWLNQVDEDVEVNRSER